jgi:hypothetical protein
MTGGEDIENQGTFFCGWYSESVECDSSSGWGVDKESSLCEEWGQRRAFESTGQECSSGWGNAAGNDIWSSFSTREEDNSSTFESPKHSLLSDREWTIIRDAACTIVKGDPTARHAVYERKKSDSFYNSFLNENGPLFPIFSTIRDELESYISLQSVQSSGSGSFGLSDDTHVIPQSIACPSHRTPSMLDLKTKKCFTPLLLDVLKKPTTKNLKTATEWIFKHSPLWNYVLDLLNEKILEVTFASFDHKLYLLYLYHEILCKIYRIKCKESSEIRCDYINERIVWNSRLPQIKSCLIRLVQISHELLDIDEYICKTQIGKINKILSSWKRKDIFEDSKFLDEYLEQEIVPKSDLEQSLNIDDVYKGDILKLNGVFQAPPPLDFDLEPDQEYSPAIFDSLNSKRHIDKLDISNGSKRKKLPQVFSEKD